MDETTYRRRVNRLQAQYNEACDSQNHRARIKAKQKYQILLMLYLSIGETGRPGLFIADVMDAADMPDVLEECLAHILDGPIRTMTHAERLELLSDITPDGYKVHATPTSINIIPEDTK